MDSLRDLADRLDAAATALDVAARTLATVAPAPIELGADTPGRPGELGRALHQQWLTAATARSSEAARAAGHLADVAASVRVAAAGYADVDEAARRRQPGEA
ncbi:type VII secretion target [Micromonospora sp. NPDC003197]